MSLGAQLVSDDLTRLDRVEDALVATCPNPALRGLIEARGLGILQAPWIESAELGLAVDLAQTESERLPPFRTVTILGSALPLVLHAQNDHFPDALMLYLRHGRQG